MKKKFLNRKLFVLFKIKFLDNYMFELNGYHKFNSISFMLVLITYLWYIYASSKVTYDMTLWFFYLSCNRKHQQT